MQHKGWDHALKVIAGKALAGWLVTDLDATLVTASPDKKGATASKPRT